MKETYVKPEIRSEVLDPEALSCTGSGGCDDCDSYPVRFSWCGRSCH